MDEKRAQDTVDALRERSTDELLRLYTESGHTDEGFEALRRLLTERNVPIPPDTTEEASHGTTRLTPVTEGPVGIGGWLILPAITLILGVIISVIGLGMSFEAYPHVVRAGYGGYFALNIMIDIGLFVYLLIATVLFFRKKASAPAAIIGLMITQIITSTVLLVIALGAEASDFAIEDGKALFRSIVGSAIWIPYFRISQRVKATFVY